jgi:hypothetical protein
MNPIKQILANAHGLPASDPKLNDLYQHTEEYKYYQNQEKQKIKNTLNSINPHGFNVKPISKVIA